MRLLRQSAHRGAVLIGVLFAILLISILLLGIGTLAIGHHNRMLVDMRYVRALDAAEAGINSELFWLSNGNTAHVSPYTATITGGQYVVECRNTDGTVITNANQLPQQILVISTGSVESVSRTVRVRARRNGSAYDYAVFAKTQGTINGNQTIQGSVGTAGSITINGSNGISDRTIGLHGASATATINPPGSYSTQRRPELTWPTVSQLAEETVAGGLTWLQASNDNNLASAYVNGGQLNGSNYNNRTVTPAIVNRSISANGTGTFTFRGKAGGANYFLNAMTFNGNWVVQFDNTEGPINIWCVAPSTSTVTFVLNGGHSAVTMAQDPTKAVRVYMNDKTNLTLNGNGTGRFGVYAINNSTAGTVTFNGNNNLYGSVIANRFTFNGTNDIYSTSGYWDSGDGLWSFDGVWQEVGMR